MKRNQAIVWVLVIIALVQVACSMPQQLAAVETPIILTSTNVPPMVTATPLVLTQAATANVAAATQPPATATFAAPQVATATSSAALVATATSPALLVATATSPAPRVATATTGSNTNISTGSCTFLATFIADVTIPDDTRIAPNAAFTKTWRVRNDGTCIWGPGKALNGLGFTGGSQLGGPDRISLSGNINPGKTVDLSVNMVAPTASGVYTSEWKFRVDGVNGVGPYIGLGTGKVSPLYARIVVGATATPTTTAAAPKRIEFVSGATGATVEGSVKAGKTSSYILSAGKAQLMIASFASAVSDLRFKIVEASTGKVLIAPEGTNTQTFLPSTGDYLIQMIGGSADANFTLGVIIPRRISFAAGAYSASVNGKITGRQPVVYLLRALSGQTMTVKVTSPSNAALLTVYGLQDGQILVRAESGLSEWTGKLPGTQDYVIKVVPSVDSTTFTITTTVK